MLHPTSSCHFNEILDLWRTDCVCVCVYVYVCMYVRKGVNATVAQSTNCPFAVNTTIELQNITKTSDSTGTLVS